MSVAETTSLTVNEGQLVADLGHHWRRLDAHSGDRLPLESSRSSYCAALGSRRPDIADITESNQHESQTQFIHR
jgi:hypothetical protein